ncbi:MAG TPA: hypothetical protein VLV83_12645 [Acidobacteriota bacterium]|nr:hypothetical protein [Acidobacteriota bacterium]
MAYYLVTATPKSQDLDRLEENLRQDRYASLRPFGQTLSHSLRNARLTKEGYAVWEEEDYCTPPLKQEREAALDEFFDDIQVEHVKKGQGWERIQGLPHLFPELPDA